MLIVGNVPRVRNRSDGNNTIKLLNYINSWGMNINYVAPLLLTLKKCCDVLGGTGFHPVEQNQVWDMYITYSCCSCHVRF